MKLHHRLTSAFLLLQFAACNRPPGSEGESEGEDVAAEGEEEDGVPPDLPCGGADLKSDDFNCGTCGNACNVTWPGTKYAAGGCVDGECGPNWTGEFPLSPPPAMETCEQFCAFGDIPCVARGCAGMTAYVCGTLGDFGTQCNLGDPLNEALIEFIGECDEPIPYPEDDEPYTFIDFVCCCDF